MKIKSSNVLEIPEGVKISLVARKVTVVGPRGTLNKDLKHMQLEFRVNAAKKTFSVVRWMGAKSDIACINTALSTVRNMVTGVTKGFRFKLRFAYAHFPIGVTVEGQRVEIRNFLGEKRVRYIEMPKNVKAERTDNAKTKDELIVEGNDLCEVSQECAKIHQLCLVKNKDIRKFLDGIFIQTKENIVQA